jgi:hypothetical protein
MWASSLDIAVRLAEADHGMAHDNSKAAG